MRKLLLLLLLVCPFTSVAEMRCGTMAHSIIRFDTKYMFMPEDYEGVSTWGGERWKNRTKGCLDKFTSVTFTLNWPSLEVSRGQTHFNSALPDRIAITYKTNLTRSPAKSLRQILSMALHDRLSGPILDMSTIRQRGWFNEELGLHQPTMPQRSPYYFLEGYWDDDRDAQVMMVITCHRYTTEAPSTCEQLWVDPIHSIWIAVDFYFDRLPDWRTMQVRAGDFFQKLIVKEIGNEGTARGLGD